MKKRIVLCADDYGQAPAISEGILSLIAKQRLSATSCLVTTPFWAEAAQSLREYRGKVDIGLHFNLTEGEALTDHWRHCNGEHYPSLGKLLILASLHQLKLAQVMVELSTQIDLFHEKMGFLPDFIDGHQHIHQFPVVREALIAVYNQRFVEQRPYVRLVNTALNWQDILLPKKIIIYASGTQGLKRLLKQNNISHNQSFAGIYDFRKAQQYPALFRQFLADVKDQGLIMCHPGMATHDKSDAIATARFQELTYFQSEQFLEDCAENAVIIGKF